MAQQPPPSQPPTAAPPSNGGTPRDRDTSTKPTASNDASNKAAEDRAAAERAAEQAAREKAARERAAREKAAADKAAAAERAENERRERLKYLARMKAGIRLRATEVPRWRGEGLHHRHQAERAGRLLHRCRLPRELPRQRREPVRRHEQRSPGGRGASRARRPRCRGPSRARSIRSRCASPTSPPADSRSRTARPLPESFGPAAALARHRGLVRRATRCHGRSHAIAYPFCKPFRVVERMPEPTLRTRPGQSSGPSANTAATTGPRQMPCLT